MPGWAQVIGECCRSLTRAPGALLLKGILARAMAEYRPLLLFMLVLMTVGLKLYRKTLDSASSRPARRTHIHLASRNCTSVLADYQNGFTTTNITIPTSNNTGAHSTNDRKHARAGCGRI
jgi:hypothetical protein